jgi:deoxyribonuclease V
MPLEKIVGQSPKPVNNVSGESFALGKRFHFSLIKKGFIFEFVMDLARAVRIQEESAAQLILEWGGGKVSLVGAADCSYDREGKWIGAAAVVMTLPGLEIVETAQAVRRVAIPYIPGFLSLREGPVCFNVLRLLSHQPDVILFDGNGIAHPRKMGLASHVGLMLDRPSIGCAKTAFFPFRPPARHRGASTVYKNQNGEKVGLCLRTRTGIQPVFVSPGHRMDFRLARKVVLICSRFRIPEPLREAHRLSRRLF